MATSRTAGACFRALADAVERDLAPLSAYFPRLARAMRTWVDVWDAAQARNLTLTPSRRSVCAPGGGVQRPNGTCDCYVNYAGARCEQHERLVALMTIVRDEAVLLPHFLRHYGTTFGAADTFVLDNDSADGSTDALAANVVRIPARLYFDHMHLVEQVQEQVVRRQDEGYKWVLFVEVDELLVVSDLVKNPLGLRGWLRALLGGTESANPRGTAVTAFRCVGFNVMQTDAEGPYDFARSPFAQRSVWAPAPMYNKPVLVQGPARWGVGFHALAAAPGVAIYQAEQSELRLAHLHFADYHFFVQRQLWKARQARKQDDTARGWGFHHEWQITKIWARIAEFHGAARPIPNAQRQAAIW